MRGSTSKDVRDPAVAPAADPQGIPGPRGRDRPRSPEPRLPDVSSNSVVRRRLTAQLEAGVAGPLTLLSAPAGYGKTQAVAVWAAHRAATPASGLVEPDATLLSLSLRDDHRSPRRFWVDSLTTLADAGLDLVGVAGPSGRSDGRLVEAVAAAIADREAPLIWVLDCAEQDLGHAVAEDLERLMSRSDGRLRLVLLTRADPPLPLHRYRMSSSVTELRASDLVFTHSEVATLMERVGIDVAVEDVATLHSRTGGWPAGIRFATLALSSADDVTRALSEFRGDTGNVAAYLMNEVLRHQDPAMADFMLHTSIVDEMTAPVVAALTGRACTPGELEEMAARTCFLDPVPGRPGRYAYLSLFRQFLRSQLAWSDPDLETGLHRSSALHLAANGEPLLGVRHAVEAGDWILACDLLVDRIGVCGLVAGPLSPELRQTFAAVPTTVEGPGPALARAALSLHGLDLPECNSAMAQAATYMERAGVGRSGAAVLAHRCLAAIAASLDDDPTSALDTVVSAESAVRATAEQDAGHLSTVVVGLLASARARVLLLQGDLAAARRALEDGVRVTDGTPLHTLHQDLQGMAALVAAMTGQLRLAAQATHRLLGRPAGDEPPWSALVALAWIRMDEYVLPAVEQLLDGPHAEGGFDAPVLTAVVSLLRARLETAQGHPQVARAGLRAGAVAAARFGSDTWLQRTLLAEEAATHLAEDRPEEALALLEGHRAGPEADLALHHALALAGHEVPDLPAALSRRLSSWPLTQQVAWTCLLAEQHERHGDHVGALEHLSAALRLSASERLRRPFLEADSPVLELVAQASPRATRWLRIPAPPAHNVSANPPGQLHLTGEVLTPKEFEVLSYLAVLYTTEEIAEAMFVSVNTVRSHIRSLLRKLAVTRRNDAVRKAWDLGLLPRPALIDDLDREDRR
jgi:LuxR family maltose regulon positive regulatory protein